MGPLRSTGCRTCVKRRVKCDETRPFCQKCARSGLQCDGVPLPFTFIDQTEATITRLALPSHEAPTRASQELVRRSNDERWELRFHNEIGLGAGREDVYFSFLLGTFFATDTQQLEHTINRTWMTACLQNQQKYPTASLAMIALATGFFGSKHRREEILKYAAAIYGRALLALCHDLQDPNKVWGFDVLAATTALSHYEYVCFTSHQGWIQHAQGVAKLIEMRGPDRFQTNPERAVLEMNRSVLILQALADRKRTFLEEEAWQSSAWSEPSPRPSTLLLFDIFSRIPGLAEDVQKLQNARKSNPEGIGRAQQKAASIVASLLTLRRQFSHLQPIEIPVSPTTSMAFDSLGPIFKTIFRYPSLEAANSCATLEAVIICAFEWQHQAFDLTWRRGVNHEGMDAIPHARQHALDVCRSVDYLVQPALLHSGGVYLLFPARIAYLAMPRASREAQWLVRVLQKLADSSGFELARNLLSNVPLRIGGSRIGSVAGLER